LREASNRLASLCSPDQQDGRFPFQATFISNTAEPKQQFKSMARSKRQRRGSKWWCGRRFSLSAWPHTGQLRLLFVLNSWFTQSSWNLWPQANLLQRSALWISH